MAYFGSYWNDNSEDIGPFSHWKDDFIYPDIDDEEIDSKIKKSNTLRIKNPTKNQFAKQVLLSKRFEINKSNTNGYDLNKVGGFKKKK